MLPRRWRHFHTALRCIIMTYMHVRLKSLTLTYRPMNWKIDTQNLSCLPSASSVWGMKESLQMQWTPWPVQVAVQWRHSPPSGPHGSTPQRTPSSSWQSLPGSSPLLARLHLLLNAWWGEEGRASKALYQKTKQQCILAANPCILKHSVYCAHLSEVSLQLCMAASHSLSALLCTSWQAL